MMQQTVATLTQGKTSDASYVVYLTKEGKGVYCLLDREMIFSRMDGAIRRIRWNLIPLPGQVPPFKQGQDMTLEDVRYGYRARTICSSK
jgi:hypothetical protein